MVEIWWSNGNENPQPVELFIELVDLEPVENVSPINVKEESDIDEDSDHNIEDFSDLDLDKVPDDIDDEGSEEVENVHAPSFEKPSRGIVLWNDPMAHILSIDPNTTHAPEFLEYTDIVPGHKLVSNLQLEELFIGKRFENKADCMFAIKKYNMKVSIDYKVAKYTRALCWGMLEG
ncbi:hypothetical protein GOBAR_DD09838 [Gossypium barbadense]|nr:hypothetical protein GOBAR_DD09838 [Gossypium barbadense]